MKHLSWLTAFVLTSAALYSQDSDGKKPDKEQEKEKQEKPAEPPVVTLKGQVIDLACYLALNGAQGGEHQPCAEACVKAGSTTGFKTADKTYVIIRDPMHQKDAPDLTKHINKDAEVTANAFTRDGIQGLKILTIK